MALDLRMQIIVDAGEAKQHLADIDRGVKQIESSAKHTDQPVAKLVQGLTGTAGQTDKLTASSAKLETTTQKLGGELTKTELFLRKYESGTGAATVQTDKLTAATTSLNTGLGTVGVRYGVLGAAVAAFMLVGAAEIKFLYDSSRLYLEKSGILEKHTVAIDDVSSAWDRLKFSVGQSLIGADVDFRWFLRSLEGGINILSVVLSTFVAKFRQDLNTVVSGLVFLAKYIPGFQQGGLLAAMALDAGGSANPLPNTQPGVWRGTSVDPFSSAYKSGVGGGLFFGPGTGGKVDWVDREAQKAEDDAIKAAAKAQAAFDKMMARAAPGAILPLMGLGGRTNEMLHRYRYGGPDELVPLSQETIGRNGLNVWERPDAPILPLQGVYRSYSTGGEAGKLYRGGSPDDLITTLGPSSEAWLRAYADADTKKPGFFSGGFGSSSQFGSALSGTILQAITGGGSMVGGIGSLLGGGLGSSLAKSLTTGVGAITGFAGGALNAILPGIGALLGPAMNAIFGKLFGPTEYEKRTRAEADERRSITAGVDVNTLKQQAAFTGRMDIFDQYQSVKGTAAPEYLKKILGELDEQTQKLTGAMERYGISWEDAGLSAKQSQIDTMAKQLITDFDVLEQAGFGVEFIIEKMGGSINDFIATAARTGTEVPFAMKPMLQKMIDMGLLTDANGVAFENLEDTGIVFAKTMTQGFDSIVSAIDRIAKALGYVFDEYDGRELHIPVNAGPLPDGGGGRGGEYDTSGGGGEYDTFHRGGYLGWPKMHGGGLASDEYPIIGQRGEYMMQRGAVQLYGRGFMDSVNAGRFQGSQKPVVHHTVTKVMMPDGRVLAEVVARETLQ